jgi:hypothetical protein
MLYLDSRQPLQPGRQVPVPAAEQMHRGGKQHRADDRRVDRQRNGGAEPHLLDMTSSPAAKPAKTATMISAAPVMIRAVEETPKVTGGLH